MQNLNAYADLLQHFQVTKDITVDELFKLNTNRFAEFSLHLDGITFDFSKNNITQETLDKLITLAQQSNLAIQIERMFCGDKINNTEQRAVLHTALRSKGKAILVEGIDVTVEIHEVQQQMKDFSERLHQGIHRGYTGRLITDIVNIGIGGSDLGPVLVTQALKPYRQNGLNIHFISSVDGYQINDILSGLNPETTLFIIASKTFTTQETMLNAHTAREWFLSYSKNSNAIAQHFVAVSTNLKATNEFGILPINTFKFWDFVGGRYSLWSAIGLSIILYIGYANFNKLLDGAQAMDVHFRTTTDFKHNLPVMLALIGVWYINFYQYPTLAISPYNTRLTRFPAYVQQLEMESNGKSVNKNGERLAYKTSPIIWGDSGINGQHAYYQLLHQGMTIVPMDIILALADKYSIAKHQDVLVANAFAQAEAFMCGKSFEQAYNELIASGMADTAAQNLAQHKVFSGNRPTNMLLLPEISPYYLGMLIALYEHKAFVQGVIWNINSFDQMGVELGKQLASTILDDIVSQKISDHDDSTTNLLQFYLTSQIVKQ